MLAIRLGNDPPRAASKDSPSLILSNIQHYAIVQTIDRYEQDTFILALLCRFNLLEKKKPSSSYNQLAERYGT